MTAEPVIKVENLVNRFGAHTVHDGLDFEIYPNEIVGVVGGSGSGKSVLMRSIIGLQRPTSGRVLIDGQDLTAMKPHEVLELQHLWGVLFQQGALFSSLNVLENVAVQIDELTHLDHAAVEEIARMKIAMSGLGPEALYKYPSELSGGMIKRAGLARALALDPKILFLDEPTAGLDPIAASAFDTLIRGLASDLGLSIFMITHDLDSLFTICDRVAVLVDKKIKVGTLEEMLNDPHPWIQDYFHGPRSRAARKSAQG